MQRVNPLTAFVHPDCCDWEWLCLGSDENKSIRMQWQMITVMGTKSVRGLNFIFNYTYFCLCFHQFAGEYDSDMYGYITCTGYKSFEGSHITGFQQCQMLCVGVNTCSSIHVNWTEYIQIYMYVCEMQRVFLYQT